MAAVANATEAPSRTEESIERTRTEHIAHLIGTKAVKDWKVDEAKATGAMILTGRWVDDAQKEKSRYCAREFATYADPSMFAAASGVDNTALIDMLAVKEGLSVMTFDAVAAFSQAPETELVSFGPRRNI